MTPAKVVIYRPEPAVWLFVGCTIAMIGLCVSLWIDPQFLGIEFVGGGFVAWLIVVALFWTGQKRLIIARDDELGHLRVEVRHWPLAPRVTLHPLAEIRDAIVEVDPMGETSTHRVVLIQASGAKLPLTASYCGRGARHEGAAREIRALLGLSC